MERDDRSAIATFFVAAPPPAGSVVTLDGAAAQHARVRRLAAGAATRLVDGCGTIAHGTFTEVGKREASVAIDRVEHVAQPTPLEMLVPVADRDRMLLAAEKCVELQVTAWRPVHFSRSRSVSPRGEGEKFHARVRARMQQALEQSGGAWLPTIHEEESWPRVAAAVPSSGNRMLLDATGSPLAQMVDARPIILAVGPEGGLESAEIALARELGWRIAALGGGTLRFETAVIAAAAVVRAAQPTPRS